MVAPISSTRSSAPGPTAGTPAARSVSRRFLMVVRWRLKRSLKSRIKDAGAAHSASAAPTAQVVTVENAMRIEERGTGNLEVTLPNSLFLVLHSSLQFVRAP